MLEPLSIKEISLPKAYSNLALVFLMQQGSGTQDCSMQELLVLGATVSCPQELLVLGAIVSLFLG